MPKRFTATELWDEDWFLEMPNNYKLFWYYMLSKCDHAGIFRVNVKKFQIITGEKKTSAEQALKHFNNGKNRIRILAENRWFIEDFFQFQYGNTLNKNSKVHESIENLYNQANITLTSIRGLKDLKDRVIDKDKDKYKKGGTGGNNHIDKSVKGKEFLDGKEVILTDGTIQSLGKSQRQRLQIKDIKPQEIWKGYIV